MPLGLVVGHAYLERIIATSLRLLEGDLTPVERADAGRALAHLGDPRPAVMEVDALELCLVPGGPFWMGSKDQEGYDDERPQHKLELPSFWIGRFPVTNAQYRAFVEAGGYGVERFWSEAQKAKVWQDGQVKARNEDNWRTSAMDYGEPFDLPNHPAVGLAWYEMLAFTRWLDSCWRDQGLLGQGWQVGLPSEAEWEKAARGGIQVPVGAVIRAAKSGQWSLQVAPQEMRPNPDPQRNYPWQGDFDPNRANIGETGIGSPNGVECFPAGASPYGVQELSGNVLEWTRSHWKEYPYPADEKARLKREDLKAGDDVPRVLRGGAFDHYAGDVRCAYRDWYLPHLRYNLIGFRVVVSPVLPSS